MANDVREALRSILKALETDFSAGKELGAALTKKKELKEALAPIAKGNKWGMEADAIVQIALELPRAHRSHVAAAALLAEGALARTPWVSITSGQPARSVRELRLDRSEPIVYAIEHGLRISAWSLETGAHVADYTLPNDKKAERAAGVPGEIQRLVQRDDGTLRVLTTQGHLADRAPGAKSFTKVMEIGTTRFGMAASPELDFFVTQNQFDPVDHEGAKVQRVRVHDAPTRESRDVIIPFDNVDGWAWDGDAAWVGARKIIVTGEGRNDWHDENALVRVEARTGAATSFAMPGMLSALARVRPGVLTGHLIVATGTGNDHTINEIDLATRALTQIPMPEHSYTAHFVRAPDGRAYDPEDRRLVDANGTVIVRYAIAGGPHVTVGVFDAPRDRFVLAGFDPPVPVTVIAPYSAERTASAPAPVQTRALAWARPGAVLTYEIADFDAADTYRFEVLAADPGLALRITMDEEVVAERAVFADAALESAKKQVALAQGGADVDLAEEQSKAIAPIVVPRATHKKLAGGKSAPWKSEWSEGTSIDPSAKAPAFVRVDGEEIAVAAIRASGESAEVTILDDARWPLVIARVEGDCHLRLVDIALGNAAAASAPVVAPAPAAPSTPSGAGRHFELVEGTSAKFWDVSVAGSELTTRFGKIGTSGQSSTKDLGSADAATKEEAKLIREKTKKGYVEKS